MLWVVDLRRCGMRWYPFCLIFSDHPTDPGCLKSPLLLSFSLFFSHGLHVFILTSFSLCWDSKVAVGKGNLWYNEWESKILWSPSSLVLLSLTHTDSCPLLKMYLKKIITLYSQVRYKKYVCWNILKLPCKSFIPSFYGRQFWACWNKNSSIYILSNQAKCTVMYFNVFDRISFVSRI